MDILIPFVEHRGPTHSIFLAVIVFVPLFAFYGKKALPYFLVLIQHSLLSDYFVGGQIQLFWPLTLETYGMEMGIKNPINVAAESILFVVLMAVILKNGDAHRLINEQNSRISAISLAIPLTALISPVLVKFPIDVPLPLIPAHIILIIIFLASLINQIVRP